MKTVKIVVITDVTVDCITMVNESSWSNISGLTWLDAYANKQRPMEKHATDITRKTSGDRLIQMSTHQGTRCPGERLETRSEGVQQPSSETTYYIACFQVSPSKLLTAAAMLKTREANQKLFTASLRGVPVESNENCKVVAVTAEKKVATVERLRLEGEKAQTTQKKIREYRSLKR